MAGFSSGSVFEGSLDGIADLTPVFWNGGWYILLASRSEIALRPLSGAGQPLDAVAGVALPSPPAPGAVPVVSVSLSGSVLSLLVTGSFDGGSAAFDIDLGAGAAVIAGPAVGAAQGVHLAGLWHPDGTYIASARGETGLFSYSPGGAVQRIADDPAFPLGQVDRLLSVTVAGKTFLVALSAASGTLSLLAPAGAAGHAVTDQAGVFDGIPLGGLSDAAAIRVAGTPFLVTAAATANVLAVFRIGPDGTLDLTDLVLDTLATRFGGAQALAALSADGIGHVVAGGADDGLSYLILTPEGRLVHIDSIPDTPALGLENIASVAIIDVAGGISVIAGGQGPGAATQIGLTPFPATDLHSDGAGEDVLRGQPGADIFVFTDDDASDAVRDFDPTADRLDLSAWTGLYHPDQVTATALAGGAVRLDHGQETLTVHGAGAADLTPDAVLDRVDLSLDRPVLYPLSRDLTGTVGDDALSGDAADDRLLGLEGNDVLTGAGGADILDGGAGNDVLFGGEAPDGLAIPSPRDPDPDVFDPFLG